MHKYLIGILIGLIVALPLSAVAGETLKETKRIWSVSTEDIYVDRFYDKDTTCYIAYENRTNDSMPSIDCVKE